MSVFSRRQLAILYRSKDYCLSSQKGDCPMRSYDILVGVVLAFLASVVAADRLAISNNSQQLKKLNNDHVLLDITVTNQRFKIKDLYEELHEVNNELTEVRSTALEKDQSIVIENLQKTIYGLLVTVSELRNMVTESANNQDGVLNLPPLPEAY